LDHRTDAANASVGEHECVVDAIGFVGRECVTKDAELEFDGGKELRCFVVEFAGEAFAFLFVLDYHAGGESLELARAIGKCVAHGSV
jgi:hypothetical protein